MQEHKKEETIICPNCGFAATKNYCAQCGQETHLHKETFLGMLTHFVGHYFHYDSKFWVTLKTLFTKPGKLTVAYWEKKRMRFIPPISLYIFVSIVFFFLFFSTVGSEKTMRNSMAISAKDSVATARKIDSLETVALLYEKEGAAKADSLEGIRIAQKFLKTYSSSDALTSFISNIMHFAPKVFFFLIPIMAFILTLLYRKRKERSFVDHAIFSLHIHALAFILLLPTLYEVPDKDLNWLDHLFSIVSTIVPFWGLLYLIIALQNAYKSTWVRSTIYALVISVSYVFFFFVVGFSYFAFVLISAINP